MGSCARTSCLLIVSLSLLHTPILPVIMASSKNIILNFPPFSAANLALSGDSSLQNGSLRLTNSAPAPGASSSSYSAALLRQPISFHKTQSSSFFTNFSLSIANPDPLPQHSTNVVMFFLAPFTSTRSLLLFPPHAIKNGSILAVEFFTSEFPKATSTEFAVDIEHSEGWITLRAWLGKIKKPAITERFTIPSHFVEHICVGFASLKQSSSEAHVIQNWSLKISEKKAPISGGLKTLSFITSRAGAVAVFCLACASVREWVRRKLDEKAKAKFLKNFQRLKFDEIRAAANGFGEEELIGQGGSSDVFKFKLPGSPTTFAVKRFKRDVGSQRGYVHELLAITRIRHDNILELRGWADSRTREKLLVYDFMPNGSLRRALESRDGDPLPWRLRYAVATKVASAVRYLHVDCVPAVLHCDIKSDNVLFDGAFEPKLADFGISLAGPPYSSVGASRGYAPPEWRMGGAVDASCDVYSFGVLLLEICSGRRPRTAAAAAYVAAVRKLEEEGELLKAADQRIENGFNPEEMERLLRLGLACVDSQKQSRPTMARVLMILTKEAELEEQRPVGEGERGEASAVSQPVGEGRGPSSSLSQSVGEDGAASNV